MWRSIDGGIIESYGGGKWNECILSVNDADAKDNLYKLNWLLKPLDDR